jgi:hypothetical protein
MIHLLYIGIFVGHAKWLIALEIMILSLYWKFKIRTNQDQPGHEKKKVP